MIEDSLEDDWLDSFVASEITPDKLEELAQSQLLHVIDAQRRGLRVYESLKSLNDVIGTQYGDRVLYELIQNAHDAHAPDEAGHIAVHLKVNGDGSGFLLVANKGNGFTFSNLDAIRNIGTSDKEVGEGIGNKGLGFRSVEALTDDVRIYSQRDADPAGRFNGYCFRFAMVEEIEARLRMLGVPEKRCRTIAENIPRYLVALPLGEQPAEILEFARDGFATVVALPLRTLEVIELAKRQIAALASSDAPLLLFLERVQTVRVLVDEHGKEPLSRTLKREAKRIGIVPGLPDCRIERVDLGGPADRYLVIRNVLSKEKVLEVVDASIPIAPQLKRWRSWKGDALVSVAVPISGSLLENARLFNFLPMDANAPAPFAGYLDAPFFADIDRRTMKADLPLNRHLLAEAAVTCAAAATAIIREFPDVPPTCVVDLVTWRQPYIEMIRSGFNTIGSPLSDAKVWPIATGGEEQWANMKTLYAWPPVATRLIKPRRLARVAGAHLVTTDLGSERLTRIDAIANVLGLPLSIGPKPLCEWIVGIAGDLCSAKSRKWSAWSDFYDDVVTIFEALSADLKSLGGQPIIVGANGKLHPAVAKGGEGNRPVFVRPNGRKGRVPAGTPPLPPASLSRRWRFLNENVSFSEATCDAFERAALLRRFDAIEVLKDISGALGGSPTALQRGEALVWAFKVWKSAPSAVEQAVGSIDISVPSVSGWISSRDASFPSSWHISQKALEDYLLEAAPLSPDCKAAAGRFLVDYNQWPGLAAEDRKGDWFRFLETLKVNKGLRAVPARIKNEGTPSWYWHTLFQHGNDKEGLGSDWVAVARSIWLHNPQTNYIREGEAWRLPGQIEHDQLSDGARISFSDLVLEYLSSVGDDQLTFRVRHYRGYNEAILPTPLAVFLREGTWAASVIRDDTALRRPRDCWSSQTPRDLPPRFVGRFALESVSRTPPMPLLFDQRIGLRDWSRKDTTVARLHALATALTDLSSAERRQLRDQLRRAWEDISSEPAKLPADLPLVVESHAELQVLHGAVSDPSTVFVTSERQGFAARALVDQGEAILDVGENDPATICELLLQTGSFDARLASDITLIVDGAPFVPDSADPLLISPDLGWLVDAGVLGHEHLGDPLERRTLSPQSVESTMRQIRVRWCDEFGLMVSGKELRTRIAERVYQVPNPHRPTLVVAGSGELDFDLLIDCAPALAKLIGTRSGFLETILSRLRRERPENGLAKPSDQDFARAIKRDLSVVREYFASTGDSFRRKLETILPALACLRDIETARRLADLNASGSSPTDVRQWLIGEVGEAMTDRLLAAAEEAEDQSKMRRLLDLDFASFNAALIALGYSSLSNDADFRRLFEVYLNEARSGLRDRVRRRFISAYRASQSLSEYVAMRVLPFAVYDPHWADTMEVLDQEFVRNYLNQKAEEALGPDDPTIGLPDLRITFATNQKLVVGHHSRAARLIMAWCRKHDVEKPALNPSDAQAAFRLFDGAGLLDFESLSEDRLPALYAAVGVWPKGMERSLSLPLLDLTEDDLNLEEREARDKRRQDELERRSIKFAGEQLDPADAAAFAESFARLAENALSGNSEWYQRSQPPRLARQEPPTGPLRKPGDGPGGPGRREQPPEAMRNAMGLASEYLAREYLRRRHPREMSDECWVSTNRRAFCGGGGGNDMLGYDFRVVTARNEWLYEVKSALDGGGEFEFTQTELEVAGSAMRDGKRRYRILYVPFVFDPTRWRVLPLQNPVGEKTRNRFRIVRSGSVRYRFEVK